MVELVSRKHQKPHFLHLDLRTWPSGKSREPMMHTDHRRRWTPGAGGLGAGGREACVDTGAAGLPPLPKGAALEEGSEQDAAASLAAFCLCSEIFNQQNVMQEGKHTNKPPACLASRRLLLVIVLLSAGSLSCPGARLSQLFPVPLPSFLCQVHPASLVAFPGSHGA